jgi:hypothetical protein
MDAMKELRNPEGSRKHHDLYMNADPKLFNF